MKHLIYHLVPQAVWAAAPTDQPYTPADYEREGFIHCTQGEAQVAVVANRYYRHDARVWLVLIIDEDAVVPAIKYEPGRDGQLYPHIYGPLNRDAVITSQVMPRDPDGSFKPLERR